MSSHNLDRPLSPTEKGIWLMDAGAPLNFCLIARIAGELDESVLRAALDATQIRHPPLRARVEKENAEPRFRSDGVGPISLQMEAGPEAGWLPRVEHDLTQRHPENGPLLRVILRRHDDNDAATLLLSIHHVIGDGQSVVYLLRDVLQAAGRIAAGDPPGLSVLPDTLPMEDRLPAAERGLRGTLRNGLFMARTVATAARNGRPIPVRQEREIPAHARRARVHPVVLDDQTTSNLAARCHTENTTIHGALSAAMILGILADHEDSDNARPTVGFGNPVDMRTRLDPPVGESLGFFVSMISFERRISADTQFWGLARDIRENIVNGRRRSDDFSATAMSPRLGRWLGAERLAPKKYIESWEKYVCGTGGLTNMGRLDIPTTYGNLTLETCHIAFSPSALGQFSACVSSLHGRLFWNFVWPTPSMTEAHADSLIGGIVRTLEQALAR